INRAPAKVQSALLEAMQERQVTIGDETFKLPEPFLVLATQNPIEQEGTYPLPEAQLDRFMFSIYLDYPSFDEEVEVVKKTTSDISEKVNPLFSANEILEYQRLIRRLPVADNVVEYAVKLVSKTRPNTENATELVNNYVEWGAGPRASQNLIIAAKVNAAIKGKFSPDIEDVKAVAYPILNHRIVRNYKAEAEGISDKTIIDSLL
ncbi:MAG: MoxR family ATPase, partial [Flavobacteriaceae bacterium]|nr:MoxR family ATPase [Flavobacteriaceae bacterium]